MKRSATEKCKQGGKRLELKVTGGKSACDAGLRGSLPWEVKLYTNSVQSELNVKVKEARAINVEELSKSLGLQN